jgi:ribosomal protein L33
MQHIKCIQAYLQCSSCEEIFIIWRIEGRQKRRDHKKNMYCHKCKKVTQHFEMKEWDEYRYETIIDDTL